MMSFVLRLVGDALEEGEVVGSVESVGTGARAVVHDMDELVAFLSSEATGTSGARSRPLLVADRAERPTPP